MTVPSGRTDADLSFDLDVILGSDQGTERLFIDVISSGTTIVDTLTPYSSDGNYDYELGNYSGQTITIRFRRGVGLDPGDTIYRIDNVVLFAC